MKEIGSEFWNVPICETYNNLFPQFTEWFVSGRAALKAIIKDIFKYKNVKTAALPSWCCESMITPFEENNIKVSFYSVYPLDGKLCYDMESTHECEVFLIMNYFGFSQSEPKIPSDKIIIRDITQSLFSNRKNDADYYFGSLRKWAGFWTGGFAFSNYNHKIISAKNENNDFVNYRKSAMKKKASYILQSDNSMIKKDFLETFEKAESVIENDGICRANERDVLFAKKLDVDYIKNKRKENSKMLLKYLNEYAVFNDVGEEDCPMFVPILIPFSLRTRLRNKLIENNIYCPIHWPLTDKHNISNKARAIYDSELSLVCDQRYEPSDMLRIINVLKQINR